MYYYKVLIMRSFSIYLMDGGNPSPSGESHSAIGAPQGFKLRRSCDQRSGPLSPPQVLCAGVVDFSRPNFLVEVADP